MVRDSGEQSRDLAAAAVEERDSQKITDLIEQLDRDLEETRRNAGKQR